MDPNDPLATPDQAALSASLDAYNEALTRYNAAADQYNRLVDQSDPNQNLLQSASAQLDNTRTQMGAAARDYSTLLGKIATSYQANARAAKDPNEQRLWAQEADKAQSQSDLYAAESSMYVAKTQADIDNATQRAQAAVSRASTAAQRVTSQNDRDQAAALLANAKAAQVPALSASTIALHNSQIQLAGSRSAQAIANANRAQAQADTLIPAEAQKFLAAAGWDQSRIDALNITTPVKLKDLEARTGLNDAKAQQILANIGKQQVLPYGDTNAPTLAVFQPSTGQVTGQPNPAYKNPYMQPLADRAAAIEAIRNDLASGKFGQGQAATDYANQLIAGIDQQAQLQAQGYTPQQYQQAIQNQAQFGENILSNIASTGSSAANTLLSYASRARGLGGMSFTPYESAIGMFGGNDVVQKALSLISQIKPVTDRAGAADAIARYGAASALMKAAGNDGASAPSSTPTSPDANPTLLSPGMAGTNADPQVSGSPALAMYQGSPVSGVTNPTSPSGLSDSGMALLKSAGIGA